MDMRALFIILLSVVSIAGAFYVLVLPYLSGEAKAEKRHAQIVSKTPGRRAGNERVVDAAARRKQVADSLKEMEQRNAEKARVTLETRIAQAGLDLSRTNFFVAS